MIPKYRAWDIEQKKMLSPSEVLFQQEIIEDEEMCAVRTRMKFDLTRTFFKELERKYIFLQFIGLLDRKGFEIYAGDIVHVWSEYDKGKRIYDEGNWEVYWRNDRWHLRRGGEDFDNGDYYQGDECPWPDVDNWTPNEEGSRMEIVGNIHQNSGLLGDK